MADDDPEDQLLTREAFIAADIKNPLYFVDDGEELMDYLNRVAPFDNAAKYPLPELIFLDLNMPKKDGKSALKEIKKAPHLKHIPIIVLSTSTAKEDIQKCYALGANAFVSKPMSFSALVKKMSANINYWFSIVESPNAK